MPLLRLVAPNKLDAQDTVSLGECVTKWKEHRFYKPTFKIHVASLILELPWNIAEK